MADFKISFIFSLDDWLFNFSSGKIHRQKFILRLLFDILSTLKRVKVRTGLLCGCTIYIMRYTTHFYFFSIPVYFNIYCFSGQLFNANILYKTLHWFSDFLTILLSCSYFVSIRHHIHLRHFCSALEVCVTWVQVIIDIISSPFYPNPWQHPSLLWSFLIYDILCTSFQFKIYNVCFSYVDMQCKIFECRI